MKLYLVERTDEIGYDEYDAFVVAAPNETLAMGVVAAKIEDHVEKYRYSDWWPGFPDNAQISLLGTTHITTSRIILGSFNAG